jgi:hypothetical protein
MLSKRDRVARRADKWWRSVYLLQMLMRQRDGPKALTTESMGRKVKAQSKRERDRHGQISKQESPERVCG